MVRYEILRNDSVAGQLSRAFNAPAHDALDILYQRMFQNNFDDLLLTEPQLSRFSLQSVPEIFQLPGRNECYAISRQLARDANVGTETLLLWAEYLHRRNLWSEKFDDILADSTMWVEQNPSVADEPRLRQWRDHRNRRNIGDVADPAWMFNPRRF